MEENRLEELREEQNLTKKKIADDLGVAPRVYGRWENGEASLPTRRKYQISNYYKINKDYLLKLSDKQFTLSSKNEKDFELVYQRLRQIRKDLDMTLQEFTKILNTSTSTWSAYETGKVLILGDFLIQICKKYNYSADWILGRSNDKYLN